MRSMPTSQDRRHRHQTAGLLHAAVLAMTAWLASALPGVALQGKIDDAIGGMAGLKDAAERTGSSVENLSALKAVGRWKRF